MSNTLYLNELLQPYTSTRWSLTFYDAPQLAVPRTRTTFVTRGFVVAAATVWNALALPTGTQLCNSVNSFKRHLKTCYFNVAYAA